MGAASIYVYDFEYPDGNRTGWVRSPFPATMEAIARHGWRVLVGSGRLVFAETVNPNGIAYRG